MNNNVFYQTYRVYEDNLQYEVNLPIKLSSFKKHYSSERWLGRKVIAIPAAFMGVIKAIYHLGLALKCKIQQRDPQEVTIWQWKAKWDLQEAKGWLITLVNDSAGQFFVQKGEFHKNYYDQFILFEMMRKIEKDEIKIEGNVVEREKGWIKIEGNGKIEIEESPINKTSCLKEKIREIHEKLQIKAEWIGYHELYNQVKDFEDLSNEENTKDFAQFVLQLNLMKYFDEAESLLTYLNVEDRINLMENGIWQEAKKN